MKKLILILSVLTIAGSTTAQKLRIISFDSVGGNVGEWVNDYPPYNKYNNGTFSLNLVSNSNTSDLPLNCTSGSNTSYTRRFYSQSNGLLIGDSCTVEADSVKGSWYFQYPQSNGDVIYFGVYLGDVGIERQDANGNILWVKHYGSSKGEGFGDIAVANDGGFFVLSATLGDDGDVGTHYGDAFSTDIWVLRLDNDGEMLWGKVLGGSNWDVARTILAADDGGCYIFGGTASNDHDAIGQKGEGDLFVAKLDSLGNTVWANCYGGSKGEYDFNNSFFAEPDGWGGFYILCRTDSNDGDVQNKTDNSPDFWLVHINKDGNILWERNYGGPGGSLPTAFCRGVDGNLWLGGQMSGLHDDSVGRDVMEWFGDIDAWIIHVDTNGNIINQRTLGTLHTEYLNALYPVDDSTVIAAGTYSQNTNLPHPSTVPHTPGFPLTNKGSNDVYIAHLSYETDLDTEENKKIPFSWRVYPNPSDGNVTVIAEGKPEKYTLNIADINGKLIYTNKLKNNKLEINTHTWAKGIYTVTLSNKKHSETKKLTIK